MAKTVIDELVTILGVEVPSSVRPTINSFGTSLNKLTSYVGWLSAGLTVATGAISYFVEKSAQVSAETYRLGSILGANVESLQRWEYAAAAAGVSSKSLVSDLSSLTRSMDSPIPGEYNNALFMLGVSVRKSNGALKTAGELLLDISDRFRGMSDVRQLQWAGKLGISDDTLFLLKQGRQEIKRYFSEADKLVTIIPKKELKAAQDFTRNAALTRLALSDFLKVAAHTAIPVLNEMSVKFNDFIAANKEYINTRVDNFVTGVAYGFQDFVESIKEAGKSLVDLIPGAKGFTDSMTEVEGVALAVKIALTALSAVMTGLAIKVMIATWPFWAIVAAIAATYLIAEDLFKYFKGEGFTVTSLLVDKMKSLKKSFEETFPGTSQMIKDTIAAGKQLWEFLKPIRDWTSTLFVDMWKELLWIVREVSPIFGTLLSVIDKAMTLKLIDAVDFMGKVLPGTKIIGKMLTSGPTAEDAVNWIGKATRIGSTTNNNVNINITGDNAPAVADEVARRVNDSTPGGPFQSPGALAPLAQ